MFLFLPILIVISLIQFAAKSSSQINTVDTNKTLAYSVVFGLLPLLIAISAYGAHHLNSKKPQLTEKTLWLSATMPYFVFVYLIFAQSYGLKNEKWLPTVFNSSTQNFEWLRQFFTQTYIVSYESIQVFGVIITSAINILCVFQFYFIFSLYLFIYYWFNQKGSRDYNTPRLVAFIGANRIVILGFWFVIFYEVLSGAITWQNNFFAFKKLEASGDLTLLLYCILEGVVPLIGPFVMLLVFPLILPMAAGWRKLEDSQSLSLLAKTAKENKFKYNKIYLANNPGLITAGVIGVFSRTTNLFFTKEILMLLNEKEIEAVMLHEIGHSKYNHIVFYLFFIMLIQTLLMFMLFIPGIEMFAEVITVVILVVLIRFAWGWLSRQCERQADLNAAEVQGTPEHIVNSFYKIAGRGHALDKPSWHHGTLRVRIQNLIDAFQVNGNSIRKSYHKRIKKIKAVILLSFLIVNCIWIYINFTNTPKGDLKIVELNNVLAQSNYQNKNYALSEKYYIETISFLENKDTLLVDNKKKQHILIENYYNLSCCYALSGKHKEAIDALNKTFPLYDLEIMSPKNMYALNVLKVQTDPDFNAIRKMPEYALFIEELKKIEKGFSIQSWQEN